MVGSYAYMYEISSHYAMQVHEYCMLNDILNNQQV